MCCPLSAPADTPCPPPACCAACGTGSAYAGVCLRLSTGLAPSRHRGCSGQKGRCCAYFPPRPSPYCVLALTLSLSSQFFSGCPLNVSFSLSRFWLHSYLLQKSAWSRSNSSLSRPPTPVILIWLYRVSARVLTYTWWVQNSEREAQARDVLCESSVYRCSRSWCRWPNFLLQEHRRTRNNRGECAVQQLRQQNVCLESQFLFFPPTSC